MSDASTNSLEGPRRDTIVAAFTRDTFPVSYALLVVFLTAFPLSTAVSGWPLLGVAKQALLASLLLVLIHDLLHGLPAERMSVDNSLPIIGLSAYAALVLVSSLLNGKPLGDLGEYVAIPVSVLALLACERRKAGSFFQAVMLSTVFHLVIAVVVNDRTLDETSGVARLGGLSHPITLGVEAGIAILYGLRVVTTPGQARKWGVALVILGGYVLIEAFSKTAILGTLTGLLTMVSWRVAKDLTSRMLILVTASTATWLLVGPELLATLVGGNLEVYESATGRTSTWTAIWNQLPEYYLYGYGWAPLRDATGRDSQALGITTGFGAENSFLAALLMAGVLGFILFLRLWGIVAVRGARCSGATEGFSIALLVLLTVACLFVDALAGLSFLWWWLLAVISLGRGLAASPTRTHKNPQEPT